MGIAAIVFAACTAILAGFAAYYARRCALYAVACEPIELRKVVAALSERVRGCETTVSDAQSNATLWRAEMTALADSVDTNLDRVERKRRSAAASASRMASMVEGDPNSLEALTAKARGAGML